MFYALSRAGGGAQQGVFVLILDQRWYRCVCETSDIVPVMPYWYKLLQLISSQNRSWLFGIYFRYVVGENTRELLFRILNPPLNFTSRRFDAASHLFPSQTH